MGDVDKIKQVKTANDASLRQDTVGVVKT